MATLKGVSIKKLNNSLEKVNKCFKELKTLLKNEIVENNGELSYDRFEEYDNLFNPYDFQAARMESNPSSRMRLMQKW